MIEFLNRHAFGIMFLVALVTGVLAVVFLIREFFWLRKTNREIKENAGKHRFKMFPEHKKHPAEQKGKFIPIDPSHYSEIQLRGDDAQDFFTRDPDWTRHAEPPDIGISDCGSDSISSSSDSSSSSSDCGGSSND